MTIILDEVFRVPGDLTGRMSGDDKNVRGKQRRAPKKGGGAGASPVPGSSAGIVTYASLFSRYYYFIW